MELTIHAAGGPTVGDAMAEDGGTPVRLKPDVNAIWAEYRKTADPATLIDVTVGVDTQTGEVYVGPTEMGLYFERFKQRKTGGLLRIVQLSAEEAKVKPKRLGWRSCQRIQSLPPATQLFPSKCSGQQSPP